jgi:hypothetical protein
VVVARLVWPLTPLEAVGPLRFGMTMAEAAAVVPEAVELRRFQADPWDPGTVGIGVGLATAEPAFYQYFDDAGRLYCVAADAVLGPQVTLNGVELTARSPEEAMRWLGGVRDSLGRVCFGPRGNPGIDELGLVLRVQATSDDVLTRPVLVGREWSDRCSHDAESWIPECEWVGRLWPYPFPVEDKSLFWPSADDAPAWAGRWTPPF